MMAAAIDGLEEGTPHGKQRPLCIAVTQLTSTSKEAMNEEQGIPGEVMDSVIRYAKMRRTPDWTVWYAVCMKPGRFMKPAVPGF